MAKRSKIKLRVRKISVAAPENNEVISIIVRPRVRAVCKTYNIGFDTLVDFLKEIKYREVNENSLLDSEVLILIEKHFNSDKNIKDQNRGKTNVEFIKPNINSGFDKSIVEKEIEKREPLLPLKIDLFSRNKHEVIYKQYPKILSKFNDTEVYNLCSKMSSSFARKLCKQLDKSKSNKQLILYQLHFISNKALQIFGGKILSFIYSLRPLKFKNSSAIEVQTYSKVIPGFPILSFQTENSSFKISFFVKQDKKNKLKADLRIFSSKNFEEVGSFDEDGYVLYKLEKFKPYLTMFCQEAKNKPFEIFSGVESGSCEICGRELTHPGSLRIGIGPNCASNYNIDKSLYND